MPRALICLPMVFTLAACGTDKAETGAGTAAGQILPGSASDAMLPLDTVRSQAPLAPKSEGEGGTGKAKGVPQGSDVTESPASAPAAEAAPDEPADEG